MKRRWLNILAALSLFLCIVMIALWIRTAFRRDVIYRDEQYVSGPCWRVKRFQLESAWGKLFVETQVCYYLPDSQNDWRRFEGGNPINDRRQWTRSPSQGIQFYSGKGQAPWSLPPRPVPAAQGTGTEIHLEISYAVWAFLFGLLPAYWALRRLRDRLAIKPGMCRKCGYNLTGNVSGICPECGTAVPPRTESVR